MYSSAATRQQTIYCRHKAKRVNCLYCLWWLAARGGGLRWVCVWLCWYRRLSKALATVFIYFCCGQIQSLHCLRVCVCIVLVSSPLSVFYGHSAVCFIRVWWWAPLKRTPYAHHDRQVLPSQMQTYHRPHQRGCLCKKFFLDNILFFYIFRLWHSAHKQKNVDPSISEINYRVFVLCCGLKRAHSLHCILCWEGAHKVAKRDTSLTCVSADLSERIRFKCLSNGFR